MRRALASLVLFTALAAKAEIRIGLAPVASRLDHPVALTHAPGDDTRTFVTEQTGRVRVLGDGQVSTFLDITDRVLCCGERGLLSIAFHPRYETNGFVYANYTDKSGATVVSRFSAKAGDPDRVDPASETLIIRIEQPFSNHNGGQLQFGPDGYLYIGMGDGGSAGDPNNRAQSLLTLLGKILRIDVDGGAPYVIPPDNPFAFLDNAKSEIWALGLRNPWRFTFDRLTGDLFIGDVGQNRIEEIDYQPAGSMGGTNYGWRWMEGSRCYTPSSNCEVPGLTLPILQYTHDEGCSVTGGYLYRGPYRGLSGIYFYGDYCTGTIWGAARQGDGSWKNVVELRTSLQISSFGEDAAGNVYVVGLDGRIFRIEDTSQVRRRGVRRAPQ